MATILIAASSTSARSVLCAAALVLAISVLGGCASTHTQAEWTDPAFAKQSYLRGAKVLVVCDAKETAVKRICQDQVSQQLNVAGATPVIGPETSGAESGPAGEQILAAARDAGAKAVLRSSIAPDATVVSPGPSVGFGIGGFGMGSSNNVGGSVGVSMPVGGERVNTAYAAEMSLTDVASGRLIWSSTVSSPASRDVNGQVASLAKTGVESATKAGLF
jgi:hypothetical protein